MEVLRCNEWIGGAESGRGLWQSEMVRDQKKRKQVAQWRPNLAKERYSLIFSSSHIAS